MANSDVFDAFLVRYRAAIDAGLVAAAATYQAAVRAKLEQGYTSGAFTSGASARNVLVGVPVDGRAGRAGREIHVGTEERRQAYWELGGYNAFTRHFERVEHWRNALMESGPSVVASFRAAATQTLRS